VKIELTDTTASKISSALVQARRAAGSPAMSMVLTLVVVTDEEGYAEALAAAGEAGKEHPSRVLGVIIHGGRQPAKLDASVRIAEGMSGESVLLRFYGELGKHADSVVMPLLLPESPVVVWWPGKAPAKPAEDPIGALGRRRVTDAAASKRPIAALLKLCGEYTPGDTDLTWTRTTPWRALLAAAMEQYPCSVKSAVVEAERANASAELIASWLADKLKVPASVKTSDGPGITAVRLVTPDGEIAITRPDGLLARYAIPGQPERAVALKRRGTAELLAEELRRLDPDDIYAEAVIQLGKRSTDATNGRNGKTAAKSSDGKAKSTKKTAKARS
jgi:glucose-6-phosphate dehydrogenase assembly protein OpcA